MVKAIRTTLIFGKIYVIMGGKIFNILFYERIFLLGRVVNDQNDIILENMMLLKRGIIVIKAEPVKGEGVMTNYEWGATPFTRLTNAVIFGRPGAPNFLKKFSKTP